MCLISRDSFIINVSNHDLGFRTTINRKSTEKRRVKV